MWDDDALSQVLEFTGPLGAMVAAVAASTVCLMWLRRWATDGIDV